MEDNMKLKVEIKKNELKQREMEQLLQHDFVMKAAVARSKNKFLQRIIKKMESDHKNWTAHEKMLRCELKELKSSQNKSN